MNSGKKEIDFDIPSPDQEISGPIPDIDMYDDDGPSMEFSNAGGFGFWTSKKKAAELLAAGDKPAFGKGGKGLFFDLKDIALSPVRGAFLGLLKLNVWGMATKLSNLKTIAATGKNPKASQGWSDILNHWTKFGGDQAILLHNIDIAKGRKELLLRASKKISLIPPTPAVPAVTSGANGNESYSNVVGETAAMITAATPITIYVVKTLTDNKDAIGGLNMNPADQAAMVKAAGDQANLEKQNTDSKAAPAKGSNMIYYYIGGGLLLAIGGYILYKKYSKK